MNSNMNEMTDEQKEIYYVTKISKFSSEEYKLKVGEWVGFGIAAINFFASGIIPTWTITPSMASATLIIGLYCMIAKGINSEQQSEAYDELAKLNRTKRKSR